IFWRHNEYPQALEILRTIADRVGGDDPVARAFALREAAISAAKCGDWQQAEKWFLEAQSAARRAQADDMGPMAVGLGADAGVAALERGDISGALTLLAEAVEALTTINPDASLRTAYIHRVIRHAVLWAQSRTWRRGIEVVGEPIAIEVGACSD